MKHVIPTGTDVASICFFDPAALPADFDERIKKDTTEVFQALVKEGRAWWKETESDGAYLFHFYVGEPLPENFRAHCFDKQTVDRFLVPSGTVWACGAEYAAKAPAEGCGAGPPGGLAKFTLGGKFEVPPGEYALSLWRGEWPEDAHATLVQALVSQRMGAEQSRRSNLRRQISEALYGVSVVATIYAFGFVLVKNRFDLFGEGTSWAWPVTVVGLWAATITALRPPASPGERQIETEAALEFPTVIVQMEKLSSPA